MPKTARSRLMEKAILLAVAASAEPAGRAMARLERR
jgi:hypothetical protein